MALRFDIGTLRPPKRMKNGMLRADGLLTRTGVFEYLNSDGSLRREYRPPEEVFHQDSMESFALAPFTDGHPPEVVTAENARKYAVGSIGELVRRDGRDHLAASVVVFDSQTIAKMEAGQVQLSCGYEVDLDETPGVTPEGERFDAIQRNIRGNHVALVAQARAGDSARVRMDGAVQQEKAMNPTPKTEETESKGRADQASDVAAVRARADQAESDLKRVQDELNALKKQRDDEAAASALRAVVTRAQTALPKERFDGLTQRQVMERALMGLHGSVPANESDEYIRARFDLALDAHAKTAGQIEEVGRAVTNTATVTASNRVDAVEAARLENEQYQRSRGKAPLKVVG